MPKKSFAQNNICSKRPLPKTTFSQNNICPKQPSFTSIYLDSPVFTSIHLDLPRFTLLYPNLPHLTLVELYSPLFTSTHLIWGWFTSINFNLAQFTLFYFSGSAFYPWDLYKDHSLVKGATILHLMCAPSFFFSQSQASRLKISRQLPWG